MSSTMNMRWTMALALCAALLMWGCESPKSEKADDDSEETSEKTSELEAGEDGDHDEFYSPYLITGEGDLKFDTISFTDVGIVQPEPEPAERFLLETIAESLAYEIAGHPALEFDPVVEYDEALLNPENHRACDADHLYVALWRGYEPERWGYSLWSGCHERQKFAWEEVVDPEPEVDDTIEWVEPLTQSIVDSIHDAHVEDCFSAVC